MAKTSKDYDFNIATQTRYGKWDRNRLRSEVDNSVDITTKQIPTSPVGVDGTTIRISFYVELGEVEITALTAIVAAHNGEPVPSETVQLYKVQDDGTSLLAGSPRTGSEIVIGSHNYSDQTTWFMSSARVTDESLEAVLGESGLKWKSPADRINWIDLRSGRMHNQEHWAALVEHGYQIVVKVDGVEKTQCAIFKWTSADGDYYIDYDNGHVVFFENQEGHTVTASYSYANGSSFVIEPSAGRTLRIEDAEADFSADAVLNTSFGYVVMGFVDAFAPEYVQGANSVSPVINLLSDPPASPGTGDRYLVNAGGTGDWLGLDGTIVEWSGTGWNVTAPSDEMCVLVVIMPMYFTFRNSNWNPTPYASGDRIDLQRDMYHRVSQIVTEARGALPPVQAIGASAEEKAISDLKLFRMKSRGMKNDVQAIPFNYATARDLYSSAGMQLHVITEDDVCTEGEGLTITFYCTSVSEDAG